MGRSQEEATALEHKINGYVVIFRCQKASGIQLRFGYVSREAKFWFFDVNRDTACYRRRSVKGCSLQPWTIYRQHGVVIQRPTWLKTPRARVQKEDCLAIYWAPPPSCLACSIVLGRHCAQSILAYRQHKKHFVWSQLRTTKMSEARLPTTKCLVHTFFQQKQREIERYRQRKGTQLRVENWELRFGMREQKATDKQSRALRHLERGRQRKKEREGEVRWRERDREWDIDRERERGSRDCKEIKSSTPQTCFDTSI